MKVKAIKTKKVVPGDDLFEILDRYLPKLNEGDVIAIASKIISICQGDVVRNDGKTKKYDLMVKEADYYLPEEYVNYGIHLTIKDNMFVASSGIDESNAGGYFILWPKHLQDTTNKIWQHLRKKHGIIKLGVVVTDGKIMPLRKGVTGIGLSWCGFEPLRDYIGKPDIFGHDLRVTKSNLVDGIASSAVLNTGEGKEQTPLAIVSDVSRLKFVDRTPTKEEIKEMSIDPKDDVYAGLIRSVKWIKGGGGN
nr:F420-0:Gamma-glutamyl ligase [uncultured bacterium]